MALTRDELYRISDKLRLLAARYSVTKEMQRTETGRMIAEEYTNRRNEITLLIDRVEQEILEG